MGNLQHTTIHRVYSEDVDHMGIVYHANHLRFFERARSELLREMGLNLNALAEEGTHFAIHEANLRYHAPAYLDDLLYITTDFFKKRATVLQFNQVMKNGENQVLCEATVMVVCLNNQFKPKRIPSRVIGFTS